MKRMFAMVVVVVVAVVLSGSCFAQNAPKQAGDAGAQVIAVVLGKQITAADKDKLDGLIFSTLLQEYAKDNQIEATDAELDAFLAKTEEKEQQTQARFEADRDRLQRELQAATLAEGDRKAKESQLETIESVLASSREIKEMTKGMAEQMRPMQRKMAQQFVKSWKINKALYEQYGGRVIFQQAGAEPLDAYRDFLREQQKKGAFQILDKQYEASFWRYFTNDSMHRFYNQADGAKFINTPWWMMAQLPQQ